MWEQPKESDIQRQIVEYLEKRRIWVWPDRQSKGKPGKGIPSGNKGVADILGIYKGKPLAIEVKRPLGEISQAQFKFLTRFKDEGGIAIVASSVEEVQRQLP